MNPHHPDTMNTQRPTPRTDAAFEAFSRGACGTVYLCAKMAELERELAHANEEVAFYSDACDRNAVLLAGVKSENEAMRAAIQEAATAFQEVLRSFDSEEPAWVTRDIPANALAALKPFLPESTCQPGE